MLSLGLARKVTVYLNEDSSSKEEQGFGSHHHRANVTRGHLPVRIEFIDSPSVVEAILPALCELVSDGLVEVQETTIVKTAKHAGPV